MEECADLLGSTEPLRQGDVVEWLGDRADPWRQHAIVVTADCDIVHSKHAGLLACVPVLTYDAYLALFPVADRLASVRQRVFEQLTAFVHKNQEMNHPEFPEPMSPDAIDAWISTGSAAGILDELGVEDSRERERFELLAAALRRTSELAAATDLAAQLTGLAEAQIATGVNTTVEQRRAVVAKEVLDRLKHLPGDAVFLRSLGRDKNYGYVVYLRVILNVSERAIATSTVGMRSGAVEARRIARLQSPFVFHLTQQLAQVFSAIGLPSAYEDRRAGFVDRQLTSLGDAM